ncbi:hypothetical protein GLYMA_01G219502v4 [Glycine max]|nr:hypothetical protein GLYMA_01G219502v4 [Glycine max]KAH1164292.1 hypothetical protein GYH30_002369 [Glycine max]
MCSCSILTCMFSSWSQVSSWAVDCSKHHDHQGSKIRIRLCCQGLEILAFPCNQFGKQEPESNDKIVDFVCSGFKSEFPIFHK